LNTGELTKDEITDAIKALKNNKASGIDNTNAELLKVDIITTSNILQ